MTLESALQGPDAGYTPVKEPTIADPVAFFRRLASSGRFHRDSGFGRIYHPGSVSLRENARTDSLHIVINADHISAHVDRVSPLDARPDETSRYSVTRAALHNAVGAAQDVVRLLRGRKGDHRSHLDCRWVEDDHELTPDAGHLLDSCSWSVHVEARVTGTLDDARMHKAFDGVLGHRPSAHQVLVVVDCPDDEALDRARSDLLDQPIPMTEWPPLRACLAHHADGDTLLLNLNHGAEPVAGAVVEVEQQGVAVGVVGQACP